MTMVSLPPPIPNDNTTNKSKMIIQSFLKGLSHQIPSSSLAPLLTKQNTTTTNGDEDDGDSTCNNKTLKVLLSTSIEALPMGSPIRKCIHEEFEQCIILLQNEILLRLEEEEKEKNDELHIKVSKKQKKDSSVKKDGLLYPIMNQDFYQRSLDHLKESKKKKKDWEKLSLLSCTNYTSPELLLELEQHRKQKSNDGDGLEKVKIVCQAFQRFYLSGYMDTTNNTEEDNGFMDSIGRFVHLYHQEWTNYTQQQKQTSTTSSSVVESQLKTLRSFFSIYQMIVTTTTSSSSMGDGIHLMTAQELGNLLASYVVLSIKHPEAYVDSQGKRNKGNESDSSDSSDSEEDGPMKKKARIVQRRTKAEMKLIKEETLEGCINTLSIFYALMSSSKKVTAAMTIGILSTMEDENDSNKKKNVMEDIVKVLLFAMEQSPCIEKKDLPARHVSNAARKCTWIRRWAEKKLGLAPDSTLKVQDMEESSKEVEEKENENEIEDASMSSIEEKEEESESESESKEESEEESEEKENKVKETSVSAIEEEVKAVEETPMKDPSEEENKVEEEKKVKAVEETPVKDSSEEENKVEEKKVKAVQETPMKDPSKEKDSKGKKKAKPVESPSIKPAPRQRPKQSFLQKTTLLNPVPETDVLDETTIEEPKVASSSVLNTRSTRSRTRSMSGESDSEDSTAPEPKARSTRSTSKKPPITPGSGTRGKRRAGSVSTLDSNNDNDSISSTPSRRSTRARTRADSASSVGSDAGTPLRKSTRGKASVPSTPASDSEVDDQSVNSSLRRSARKRKKSQFAEY